MAVDFEALDLIRTQNKAEQHERQKIKFLEELIKTLETAIESHAKILARFQMTENKEYDFFDSPPTFVEVGDKS